MYPSFLTRKTRGPVQRSLPHGPVREGSQIHAPGRGTDGGRVGWHAPLRRASSVVRIGIHYWRDRKWRPAGSTRSSTSGFVCWRGWQKNPPSPIEPDRELVRDRRPKMFPLFCVMRHRRPFDLDGSRRDEGRGHDPAVAASSMCEAGRSRSSAGSCTSPGTPSGRSCARVRPPSASAGPSPTGVTPPVGSSEASAARPSLRPPRRLRP